MRKDVIVDRFTTRWQDYYGSLIRGELKPLNRNGEFRGLCPLHSDTNPSLTINQNTGFWKCFGCDLGGDAFDFWAKLKGLSTATNFREILTGIADHFSLDGRESEKPKKRIDRAHSYTDKTGKLLFQTVRYEPKDFRQRQPDVKGGWVWNLQGVRLVPYQLPRLVKAQEVLIVEGEKDVENLIRLGFCATTSPMGVGKWRPEYSDWFKEKDCILIPDNDQQGSEHMNAIAASLQGEAASIKLLELPDLPEKGDVSDWISKQPDRETAFERLSIMIENTEPWTPPVESEPATLDLFFALTDFGNAERLVKQHYQNLRFCCPWHKWLVWNGKRWEVDATAEVFRKAKKTVRKIYGEAKSTESKKRRKKIGEHAMRSESESKIKAMISLAESEFGIPVLPEWLDANPWLLNVENGVIDLRTGLLSEHCREDYITQICPVNFDQTARCDKWLDFLRVITDGDQELIQFLQRVLGYCLTGRVGEHKMFFLHGEGANGKTTFLKTVKAIMGNYAIKAASEILITRPRGSHTTDLTDLKGKRLAITIEVKEGRHMAEALLKELTGGDTIRARRMREDNTEWEPTHKIILAANHKPIVTETTIALWRRIDLIPFTVTIPEKDRIKDYHEILFNEEKDGILRWIIEGCLEWQKHGLAEPEKVRAATKDYRSDMDILGEFIMDFCIIGQADEIKNKHLRAGYEEWCRQNGEKAIGSKAFSQRLEEKGFIKTRTKTTRNWKGLRLKTSLEL